MPELCQEAGRQAAPGAGRGGGEDRRSRPGPPRSRRGRTSSPRRAPCGTRPRRRASNRSSWKGRPAPSRTGRSPEPPLTVPADARARRCPALAVEVLVEAADDGASVDAGTAGLQAQVAPLRVRYQRIVAEPDGGEIALHESADVGTRLEERVGVEAVRFLAGRLAEGVDRGDRPSSPTGSGAAACRGRGSSSCGRGRIPSARARTDHSLPMSDVVPEDLVRAGDRRREADRGAAVGAR